MFTHPVPGDGHCFFRSVAFQTQAGEGAHGELRAAVVRAVAADAEAYARFLVEGDIGGWLAGMFGSEWADDLAVQACVNLLRRPVLIWRLGLEQEPTLKVPWFWGPTEPVTPLYLLLDEIQPGCEHYNVLVQQEGISEGRVAVEESLEPAWENQPFAETYLSKPTPKRGAQASAGAENGNAKRRRFNAPRPKPKPVGKNNKSKDKHEMPAPMIKHRRYTCKTTPPPELRDDILTEMAKVPVTPAGTLHPHRKVEDMIKAGTPTYIMHELCKVGSLVTRRAYDIARTVHSIYGTFTCRRRLYPQPPLFRLTLLSSLMPGARCREAAAPSHRATRRSTHRCRRRPTLAQSLLRLPWMHLDFTGRR